MRFKVGDRVIRVKTPHPFHGTTVGSHGSVTMVDECGGVLVKFDGTEESVVNDHSNLELLPAERVLPDFYYDSTTTKPSNPKDRAATHRLDLTLFPETARIFGAVAMTEGDSKYGAYNYRTAGVRLSTYVAALSRHIGKYYDRGEWADEKTGVPHLANALACIAVLIDGHVAGNITDDRPPAIQGDLYTWGEAQSKSLHEMFSQGPERFTHKENGAINGHLPDWLAPKS